ncbi:MAG: V-type ATP synthase subunit F [Methanothermobacter thermautotrophicus]|nr:V-type ATP synthase subunit F [Methanothermobacter thermautotrophicus]
MTSNIAVVGDRDTVTGFRLGGVREGYVVETPEEAEETIRKLVSDGFSIIIVTEKMGDELREFIEETTSSSALPMIIEIPDKTGPSERETDPLRDLIKRVIGVEMVK